MKTIKLIAFAVVLLVSVPPCRPQSGCKTGGNKTNLLIEPIDRSKDSPIWDLYYIKKFVDLRTNKDRSSLFGRNKKAHIDHLAYYAAKVTNGRYRITLQSRSGSDSFGRLIDVCPRENPQWNLPYESVEVPREFGRVHIVSLLTGLNSVESESADVVFVGKFQNTLDGTDMSDLFKDAVADHIPYGSYHLEAAVGLAGVERDVDVFQPDVWVFSDSKGFYGDSDGPSSPDNIVSGELRTIPANEKPVFMVMSGVYMPYTINSVVSDMANGNGTFSFIGTNPVGEYMLYTIGKSGILDAREFKAPRESKIVIDLAHPSTPKIDDAP
jgi:hypothetical protein